MMQNKKLGVIFLGLSVVLAFILVSFINQLGQEARELGCFADENCMKIEASLNITHLAFGVLGFVFALGFYMLVFSRGEELLMKRLDLESNKRNEDEQFQLITRGLDEYEKKVFGVVREQEGITQNTLQIKAGMSKAKLSYVLQGLERKGLIARKPKGKTLAVHLK